MNVRWAALPFASALSVTRTPKLGMIESIMSMRLPAGAGFSDLSVRSVRTRFAISDPFGATSGQQIVCVSVLPHASLCYSEHGQTQGILRSDGAWCNGMHHAASVYMTVLNRLVGSN